MAPKTNGLLFLMLLIVWGSYVSASRKLLTDKERPPVEEEGSSSPPKTIIFFMHHLREGVQGTGNAISGLPNQFGNSINFNGIVNGNGPLPLTIPSGAINNSPFTTGGAQGNIGSLIPSLGFQNSFPNTNVVNGGLNPLGGATAIPLTNVNGGAQGIGSLIPGLGLQNSFPNTNIISGGLNPQNPLGGASSLTLNNVIAIEDTLTEGPDLHSSAVLGKGEGYYYHLPTTAEEEDTKTMLLAFTAKFEGSEYGGSSIEFSGKEKMELAEREIAVVGGSGVFHNAQGHALIETVSHTVDETVLKFTATLSYE